MTQTYFLGANSRKGFVSLYHEFPPDPDAFLHIIKSGPGTGKSSFLRRIGRAGEERALDVHYVLCSGDPDSLDAVYIPAIGQAWVDGTAPHVIEPKIFGLNSDYLNLGAFFRGPFSSAEAEKLKLLNAGYKARYQAAYDLLGVLPRTVSYPCTEAEKEAMERILTSLPSRQGEGSVSRRFLSAVSCRGILRLADEYAGLAAVKCAASLLFSGADMAQRAGWDAILCLSPLEPEQPEALLIPEAGVAFTAFSDPDPEKDPLLRQALFELRSAKGLHDELESVYHPHINFNALDAYANTTIERYLISAR